MTPSFLGSLAAVLLVLQGCGSSGSTPKPDGGNPDGGQTACTLTLSGGVSSVHSCAVTLAYDGAALATDFSLSTTNIDPATVPNLYASIQIAGSPVTASFPSTDANIQQGLLAISAGDSIDAWSADSAGANTAATGTFTLTITALGSAQSVGGSSIYTNTHGTLDAMLIPVTVGQTTPAITAHAQF